MIFVFLAMCMMILFTLRCHTDGIDKLYLSKEYTQTIKGIFIITVFLSHIKGYTTFLLKGDEFVNAILIYLGQLMVAYFLFTSGYGIMESIKKKGIIYIRNMPKNRIGKTFFEFVLAILLFLIMDIFLGHAYSGKTIVLAFTGWTSIGNSNWYMFAIFIMYIITFLSFSIFSKSTSMSIMAVSVLSLLYIYIMSQIKENWWSDTCLCYVAGMWYSYLKNEIDCLFNASKNKNFRWVCITTITALIYLYISHYRNDRLLTYNLTAVCFCLLIVLLSMKISIRSKGLKWCGENLFWLYILQRIPMIIFDYYNINRINSYLYLALCLGVTIVIAQIMNKFTSMLIQKSWWSYDVN